MKKILPVDIHSSYNHVEKIYPDDLDQSEKMPAYHLAQSEKTTWRRSFPMIYIRDTACREDPKVGGANCKTCRWPHQQHPAPETYPETGSGPGNLFGDRVCSPR
jgi:hypothetical protein